MIQFIKNLYNFAELILKPKTAMKKLNLFLLAGAVALIAACGPSAKEKADKARQDSIRIADSIAKVKAYEDSIAAAQAAAEQARLDSIAQAEEAQKPKKK